MGDRIIEISSPASLRISSGQLVVTREEAELVSIPVEDIGVLLLANRRITCSHAVLLECSERKVAVVVCNERYMPSSLFLPIDGACFHSKTLCIQIKQTPSQKAHLWQQLVRSKIEAQTELLNALNRDTTAIAHLPQKVLPADKTNIEATAARAYWLALLGLDFRRNLDGTGANILLNYGYAILRAALARAVVGAGLHPAIGLHHHNQGNSFCLVDDLIEPLRPCVDRIVADIVSGDGDLTLRQETRKRLVGVLESECLWEGRALEVRQALEFYAVAYRLSLERNTPELQVPKLYLQQLQREAA